MENTWGLGFCGETMRYGGGVRVYMRGSVHLCELRIDTENGKSVKAANILLYFFVDWNGC